eukprot:3694775-Pleurochrysis_carterae.AAC.1
MGFGAEFLSFEAADAALRVGVIGTDIGHCLFRGKSRPASRTWICAETHAKVPIANKTFRLDETGALRKAVKSEPSACAEQASAQERQQERLRKCAVAAATERDMYAEKFVKQLADDTSLCRCNATPSSFFVKLPQEPFAARQGHVPKVLAAAITDQAR